MTAHDSTADATALIRDRAAVTPMFAPRCQLVVLDGVDAERSFDLDQSAPRRLLIGQGQVCDVRLADPTISRRHAAVEVTPNGLLLCDLESSNGTFVNGVRIREVFLQGGETVVFGSTTARIDIATGTHEVALSTATHFANVIGASAEMRVLYPLLERIAESDLPVLLEGEPGTGKKLVAESIHDESPRKAGPFVVFDCTAMPAQQVEAALFGDDRSEATVRSGALEQASGGTLFIDEVADIDHALQAKLLRAVDRREIRRIGATSATSIDTRIIAGTRHDLDREVQARRFRDDLFYRLAVARVELPPLRKRRGDVSLLTRCFWKLLGGDDKDLPASVLQRFERHDWPGNVRELQNAVARQLSFGDLELPTALEPDERTNDLIDRLVEQRVPLPRARQRLIAEMERRYVRKMLEAHGGHVGQAAAACGVGRRYFQMIKAKI